MATPFRPCRGDSRNAATTARLLAEAEKAYTAGVQVDVRKYAAA